MNPLFTRALCAAAGWLCVSGAHAALSVNVSVSGSYAAQLTDVRQFISTTNDVFVEQLSVGDTFSDTLYSPAWQETINGVLFDVREVTQRTGRNVLAVYGSVDTLTSTGKVRDAQGQPGAGAAGANGSWLDLQFSFSQPVASFNVSLYGTSGQFVHNHSGLGVPVAAGVLVDGQTAEQRGNVFLTTVDTRWSATVASVGSDSTGVLLATDHLPGGYTDHWFAGVSSKAYNTYQKTTFQGTQFSSLQYTPAAVPEPEVVGLALVGALVALGAARKQSKTNNALKEAA
jgi:hypothetical protein